MESHHIRTQPSLPIHHQLMEMWQRLLKVEVSAIDESFLELGGDALLPEMLEEVKRITGKKVTVAEFHKDPTVRGLTRCLLRRSTTNSLFVPIQRGKDRAPFFFFHGDILGAGFYSKRLATLLGSDQSVHISPPIELNENELPRVEDLAARKRRALQECQPHGPYLLGGFCVGAVVAYEVARQLERGGEKVGTVILIEPEIGDVLTRSHQRVIDRVAVRRRHARDKVQAFMRGLSKIERLRRVWHSPWREKKEFAVRNTKKLLRKERSAPLSNDATSGTPELAGNHDWRLAAYHWVLTSYVPKRCRGRVKMLLTDEHLEQAPFILKQWQKAAPQVRVERIPGGHMSCITTHLDEIAEKIRAEIHATTCAADVEPMIRRLSG